MEFHQHIDLDNCEMLGFRVPGVILQGHGERIGHQLGEELREDVFLLPIADASSGLPASTVSSSTIG